MPRKNRKPKKHEDPEFKAKSENVSSKGTSNSSQDESNSVGCSSYSSEAVKNEKSSTDSEKPEKAVSNAPSHFSEIPEGGKSSDEGVSSLQNDGSSASFLEEVKKIDNEGNLKTTDAKSADDSLLIQGSENIAIQEKTSEVISLDFPPADRALKKESVCEQVCFSAKESHSELSDDTKLPLDSSIDSNASFKVDIICGPKQPAEKASRSERIIHEEKTSDEDSLSSGSADEDGNKIKKIKEAMKDEKDSTLEVDLNSRSIFRSLSEPGPMASPLQAVNTDPQIKHYFKKGRGKTGVPSKHVSEVTINEHKRKRAKSNLEVSSRIPMQKNKGKSQNQRTKSEPTTKTKSKLLSKMSGKDINSAGTYFQAEGHADKDNFSAGVSHQEMPAASGSSTCDLKERSPLNVSLRKRKSTEYVTSGTSENLEVIPSKRMQRGSETVGSSTRELKSSPRAKNTSPRTLRKRQNKSENKSNSDPTLPQPCRTVTTTTESMTEYVGDAAFIAVGESPPRKPTAGFVSSVSHTEEPITSKYKEVVYESNERRVITQTQSVKEYLILSEDSLSHGSPIQPIMGISSTEVTTIRAENLHTESTPDRNLNVADKPAETLTEAESSPTVSSSESLESDINVKQGSSLTCRGASPKTRGKNIKEISPQKKYKEGQVGDILTIQFPESSKEADRSLEHLSKENVKETDNYCKQSSSTNYMGARPKTCLKKIKFFSERGDHGERSDLAPTNAENLSSRELRPSFEEFKETLGVDKVEVVDINFDVFDRALGIDRSSDHSAPEHRQDFRIISPKRLSEVMSRDNGDSMNNKTAVMDPQSSEMVEQDCLPTIEEFRRTLRTDEIPPLCEDASEILNKALEEMESKRQNLQSKKVLRFLIPKMEVSSASEREKSPERQIDAATSQNAGSSKPCTNRGPVPGILAFSGYRKRASPIGLAVPDCFDLKAIANALDEILRLEFENTAQENRNDPSRSEDSEESIEDINRAIAKSGMKLKRSQVISSSSDDEFTTAGGSKPVEVTLHSSTQIVTYEMHGDISETSQSSRESSEECNPNSSEYHENSSESPIESSESDEK